MGYSLCLSLLRFESGKAPTSVERKEEIGALFFMTLPHTTSSVSQVAQNKTMFLHLAVYIYLQLEQLSIIYNFSPTNTVV
jgi:hypothetical protein